jgi:hypothetical protein
MKWLDLKTRNIRCLTCISGCCFSHVHLSTGDYILIGPDHFENINISRSRDNELWFLSKQRGSKPVKLGQKMSEGAAVSKKNLTIAFAETQAADLPAGASRIIVANLDLSDSVPKLIHKGLFITRQELCIERRIFMIMIQGAQFCLL